MTLIEKSYIELPPHIRNSQYCENLKELTSAEDENLFINVDESFYPETLEIQVSSDIQRIVDADAYFGFRFEDRVKILRNINVFWMTTTEPITRPNRKTSFFAAQVHTLLSESATHIIMSCMKQNYSELLEMAIQDEFPRMPYFSPAFSDMSFAVQNLSIDCFKIGMKYGFEINMHCVVEIAKKGNRELLELMVSTDFPTTPKACEDADSVETIEFLIEHGFPMSPGAITVAASTGNFKKMEYAISRGYKIPDNICMVAAIGGNADCLRLAFQHSDVRIPEILREIVYKDSLEAFNVALEHGVPMSVSCLTTAIEKRCVNITPGRIQKLLL